MNKTEFLDRLRKGLQGLPEEDIRERLSFYSEMIDDRMEEGFSEEEAVKAVDKVEKIVEQAVADTPIIKIAKEKIKNSRRLSSAETVLIILGSPIWLSLMIALASVVFELYISAWSVIASLWAFFSTFVLCTPAIFVVGIFFMCNGNFLPGIAMISACLVLGGLSIFSFFGCKSVTKGMLFLTKKAITCIKNSFKGKGKE